MIGLVIVTHGGLAREFKAALEHIVGPQERIEAVGIAADEKPDQRRADIMRSVAAADSGDGVIIVTDLFGGTPCNLAISLLDPGRVDVLAGLNLPMLVKLARVRKDATLDEAVVKAAEAGRKYINIASQILSG